MHKFMELSAMLASALVLLLLAVLTFYSWRINIMPLPDVPIAYWRYRHAVDYSGLVCMGLFPLGLMVVFVHVVVWRKRNVTLLAFIIGVTILLSCFALQSIASNILYTMLGKATHHDTVITDDVTYHLSSEWKVGVGGASRAGYLLWKCDNQTNLCDRIHFERIPPIFPEGEYLNTEAYLVLNTSAEMVRVIIGDDVVFSSYEMGQKETR